MATLDVHACVHATTVRERREPATGVVLLTLEAPELADATRPGQYLMAIPPSAQAAATALGVYDAVRQAREHSLLRYRQAHA